ncbi:MAG: type II toxin-antitoxin system VapC family toxin [Sedimenticolaceae bacterium]|nr:type II toxin-antitoxin system VapC family toxin [Sedimenticolaceae bacterium]
MILVDTSIWVDHLRSGDDELVNMLNASLVCMHPFVLGELACGNLRQRTEILSLLKDLPGISVARDEEVLFYIERHELMGRGIGYIDAHLLAAVALEAGTRLWTRDKRLQKLAEGLGIAHVE